MRDLIKASQTQIELSKKKFDNNITQIEKKCKLGRGERIMKLKKGVQGVLVFIAVLSIVAIMTTLDSEWSIEYFTFVVINLAVFSATSLTLKKFGRWE